MWGLECWVGALVREAASAFLGGPRTAGRALPHSTLMFLRADRACCGGYTASASRFGGAALWRVSRWREEVDEAVLDRVLARFLRVERYFLVVLVVGLL